MSIIIVPGAEAAGQVAPLPARAGQVSHTTGRVDVVGLGPAGRDWLTPQAMAVLAAADDIVGYAPYVDRVARNPRQQRHASDNTEEAQRAEFALDLARRGRRVAVVSSGDPGVFAMAATVCAQIETGPAVWRSIDVAIVPGVTAMLAVAARAGAPFFMTPKEKMMAASVMFHLAGVNKKKFMDGVRTDPQTYKDWGNGGGGDWNIETSGKEDEMFSPFIKKPFQKAIKEGLLPANLNTIAGTWGAMHDTGELTYMNLIHMEKCDGTNPDDLTKFEIEGRRQTMLAIEALRSYMPGCETARLRNFGMTIGIRDTRKIDAAYNMTETDVREQGKFEDSIGIYPEFIDGYGILILPTTGRYFQIPFRSMIPKKVKNLLVAGRSTGGDRVSHAAIRNMSCCAVAGQGAGVAAALSLKTKTDFDRLDISAVQNELTRQGVRIH